MATIEEQLRTIMRAQRIILNQLVQRGERSPEEYAEVLRVDADLKDLLEAKPMPTPNATREAEVREFATRLFVSICSRLDGLPHNHLSRVVAASCYDAACTFLSLMDERAASSESL